MISYNFRRAVEAVVHALFGLKNWTPTVTQSGNVVMTVVMAKYRRTGGELSLRADLTVADATAAVGGNAIVIGGLPMAILSASIVEVVGFGHVGGAANNEATVVAASTSTLQFICDASSNYLGVNPNILLANGNKISFRAVCRV